MKKPFDITERAFEFAVKIIELASALPQTSAGKIVANQLIRSGTSIGANVEEAVAASSKQDFTHRMNIALREARETDYWLRVISATKMLTPTVLDPVLKEIDEIKRILGAIVSSARGKRKKL